MNQPAIVIAAHNRPAELRRLLTSVLASEIPAGTDLVLSLDLGGDRQRDVQRIAHKLVWPHGDFRLIEHDRIGLVGHFHACGDLTTEYESVVFLEDDLVVGPGFYQWTQAALSYSSADARIAGVSLAAPFFDGYRHLPFEPVFDGADGFYMQVPWYDGMAWTNQMWQAFRSHSIDATTPLHAAFAGLDDDEWFPDATRYLIETERFHLLPHHAHASNSGAAGAHFANATDYFQVPVALGAPTNWRFDSLDETRSIYDDHMELTPTAIARLAPELGEYDLVVDLGANRDLSSVAGRTVLTTRPATNPIRMWGSSMHPLVANVALNAVGEAIVLADASNVDTSDGGADNARQTLERHATRGRTATTAQTLRSLGAGLRDRISRGR